MTESENKKKEKNKVSEIKTFTVPFSTAKAKENITIFSNNSTEHIINQAFKLHSEGNNQGTIKKCKEILAIHNNSIKALKLIAKSYLAIGCIEDARLYLNKALNIKSDDFEIIKDLGNTYQAIGDNNTAKNYYHKAISINSSYAPALTNLGSIELYTGKKQEALSLLIKATESDPLLAPAWGNLANGYAHLGKTKEAEIACHKAIKLNSNLFNSHFLLGTIFLEQKKLQEASLCLQKSIELKNDFFEALLNLGIVFKELGQLKQAEIYTRKAIKLNHDSAEAHSNLGIILKTLGKLKEAEISIRKAIELNPDCLETHSNLGNILRKLGKLQEAELSSRKAIELNPNSAEARYNLGNILSDLGKLDELFLISEGTLKSNSINEGYKLSALLQVSITMLLQKKFSEALININKINNLINKGVLNKIENKQNRKYIKAFSIFITSLYHLLKKDNNNHNLEIIPHIGESHCLSFAHQTLSISSKQQQQIQPILISGGKAWHFANKENNQWKDSLNQQIKKHTYSDKIFISFGEIDCRKDEGILPYTIKKNKSILEVCEKTIKGYLDYMEATLLLNYSKRYYFGVPAPTVIKELSDQLDIKRIEMIKIYNSIFKKEVLLRCSYFLDVYELTATENGVNNNIHMCDDTHLSPKCLSILLRNHLYEPTI